MTTITAVRPPALADEAPSWLFERSAWTDGDLAATAVPVVGVPLATIGGGLGSLALVDILRLAGAAAADLGVVTAAATPSETYRYLAANSQIDLDDRRRSGAGSVMDNIWGFPSYAWREAWSDRSLKPLATVATEPLATDYFTPRAGQVYDSVDPAPMVGRSSPRSRQPAMRSTAVGPATRP